MLRRKRSNRDPEAENLLRQAKSALEEYNLWMNRVAPHITDTDDPTITYSKYISLRIDRFLRERRETEGNES